MEEYKHKSTAHEKSEVRSLQTFRNRQEVDRGIAKHVYCCKILTQLPEVIRNLDRNSG
jgi:hypothetical protein